MVTPPDGSATTEGGGEQATVTEPLGTILRRKREERGEGLAEVAQKLGIGLHTMLSWEAGISIPRLDSLARLAAVIGLDLGDLALELPAAQAPPKRLDHFGKVFRRARRERRLTPAAVARTVGASPSSIENWEEGRTLPQTRFLPRLARRLGLHLGEVDEVLGAPAAPALPDDESETEGEVEERPRPPAAAALGKLLGSRRKRRRMPPKVLAERTGIDRKTLTHYETGRDAPDVEHLGLLAWALDLDLGDFEAVLSPWSAWRRRWEHLGAALRLLRERHGWTQEELAERAGVRVRVVEQWEMGAETAFLPILGDLLDAFGLSLGELEELFDPDVPRLHRWEGIGRALKVLRERRGVDRAELTKRTGIRAAQLGRWEAGGVPRVTGFGVVAAVLELDLGDLGAALDEAVARARADRALEVDDDVRRLTRELLGGAGDSFGTERHVAVLLAATRAMARAGGPVEPADRSARDGGAQPAQGPEGAQAREREARKKGRGASRRAPSGTVRKRKAATP